MSFAPAIMPYKKKSAAPQLFPRQMTLKDGWSLADADGASLHHVKMRNRIFATGPVLYALHAGPSDSDPPMAYAKYAPDSKTSMVIEAPDESEDLGYWRFTQYSKTEALGGIHKAEHSLIGNINGRDESFVWRFTKDGVAKNIGRVGWELIRTTNGRSDLVAIWGFKTEMFQRKRSFAFVGDGMRLGPEFEIAAVMTMIRVDWLYQQA